MESNETWHAREGEKAKEYEGRERGGSGLEIYRREREAVGKGRGSKGASIRNNRGRLKNGKEKVLHISGKEGTEI